MEFPRPLVLFGFLSVIFAAYWSLYVKEGPDWTLTTTIGGKSIRFARTQAGVMEMWGDEDTDMARALGYAHAKDRQVQMMLQRVLVQGRLSELLDSTEKTIKIDRFFRSVGFYKDAVASLPRLSKKVMTYLEAYCDGVNDFVSATGRPFEFLVTSYTPEPWRPQDTLSMIKLIAYIGLAESQAEMEKFIISSVQDGVPVDFLRYVFPKHLDNMDNETITAIKRLTLFREPMFPEGTHFSPSTLSMKASNNWVIAGDKTESGSAMQCNDPHLPINRMPAIWYEFIFHTSDYYWSGISLPGIPGMVMGRTPDISYGLTYGFMDQLDYRLVEFKNGKYRRGNDYIAPTRRVETLKQKGGAPSKEFVFVETVSGRVELGDLLDSPSAPVPDGVYLATSWSWDDCPEDSFAALIPAARHPSAKAAMSTLASLGFSANMLIADRAGHIAYQQAGALFKRHKDWSGLYPVPGWDSKYDLKGVHAGSELHSVYDPPEGFIVTANDDWQHKDPERPLSINLHMGHYRAQRIRQVLSKKGGKLDFNDMSQLQGDVYSMQAERYINQFRSYLPDNEAGNLLRTWDRNYELDSIGAPLFEKLLSAINEEIYAPILGRAQWKLLNNRTNLIDEYHIFFDRLVIEGRAKYDAWFGEGAHQAAIERAVASVLTDDVTAASLEPYGKNHQVDMINQFFSGAMPRWLGFDIGPIPLRGNRATVSQGVVNNAHGMPTSFAPSWRYMTEMSTDVTYTSLPGGVSGRRFSGLYHNHLEEYFRNNYHTNVMRGATASSEKSEL